MVKIFGTHCVRTWTVAALLASAGTPLHAQPGTAPYPAKPVRVIVLFAPGGGSDILARQITPRLTEYFGQSFIVDNRGSSPIASGRTSRAKAKCLRRPESNRSEERIYRQGRQVRGGRERE
jgi:tripartite-type tricarboxylate transporter receptor subunit TctC